VLITLLFVLVIRYNQGLLTFQD